jgi:hypothetical protein
MSIVIILQIGYFVSFFPSVTQNDNYMIRCNSSGSCEHVCIRSQLQKSFYFRGTSQFGIPYFVLMSILVLVLVLVIIFTLHSILQVVVVVVVFEGVVAVGCHFDIACVLVNIDGI